MTPEQITLVQDSFAKVVPIKDAAGEMFYGRLFELDPSLRTLFPEDMTGQIDSLMTMIATAVNSLRRLGDIVPAVEDLGRRHVGYGVSDAHYATVGEALLWTLEKGLGDDFTPDVSDAWATCYGILADTMKAASKAAAA